jgi:hypothetical protein
MSSERVGYDALLGAGYTVRKDPPDLVGQDIQLTIIHSSDIHSPLFPYFVDLYGSISCLDGTIEAHDGRIRPVLE